MSLKNLKNNANNITDDIWKQENKQHNISKPNTDKWFTKLIEQIKREKMIPVNKEIWARMEKDEREIFSEMFKRVGFEGDKKYLINIKSPTWYLETSWTEERQNEFKDWLVKYLIKKKKKSLKIANQEASNFVFMYGWKLKNE